MNDQTPGPDVARQQLLSVEQFKDQSPINLRWAIQKHYHELVSQDVIYRYGRKILIDPEHFWDWLREKGRREV